MWKDFQSVKPLENEKTHSQLWWVDSLTKKKKREKFVHTYWHSRPQETETERFTFPYLESTRKAHIHPLYSPAIKIRLGNKIQKHFWRGI